MPLQRIRLFDFIDSDRGRMSSTFFSGMESTVEEGGVCWNVVTGNHCSYQGFSIPHHKSSGHTYD
jgi:hypothetical protein